MKRKYYISYKRTQKISTYTKYVRWVVQQELNVNAILDNVTMCNEYIRYYKIEQAQNNERPITTLNTHADTRRSLALLEPRVLEEIRSGRTSSDFPLEATLQELLATR